MATRKLKLVLRANAIFSILSGITMMLFHSGLSRLMQLKNPRVLFFIGTGLLLFAGFVFWQSTRPTPSSRQVRLIIWQDWTWVVASILIIGTGAFGISMTGYVLMAIVALIVADFAILQQKFM